MAMLGMVFERHGGFPDTEWDHPAPTGLRPPTAARVHATPSPVKTSVCHLPSGTSRWNKIEHRLFSFITQNWRGKPLVSYEAIVQLIASTTTRTSLNVKCGIDPNQYPSGEKVSNDEMAAINIRPHGFHGEWNYTIAPRPP
jgi:Rhodopirellula transposase DDE domain